MFATWLKSETLRKKNWIKKLFLCWSYKNKHLAMIFRKSPKMAKIMAFFFPASASEFYNVFPLISCFRIRILQCLPFNFLLPHQNSTRFSLSTRKGIVRGCVKNPHVENPEIQIRHPFFWCVKKPQHHISFISNN